jgi:serine/threonine protein kinase
MGAVDISCEAFLQSALAAGLLVRHDLDEALAALRWSDKNPPTPASPPTAQQVADKLVELGRLNAWQARQLLDGRTKFNLGPFWMIDWIGQGGMGQVFKAEDRQLGGLVAVKVLPRSKSTPEAIAYFEREIRALAQLDHPNLVRAIDHGHEGNVYYLVTDYVPGTDLRKLVRRQGPLGMSAAAQIISEVAQGLEHAHQQGLIHRDVKPGNVLVAPDGHAKLSDLGLAGSVYEDPSTDPRFGKIVGTADYLSPDHIKRPTDPRPAWDIYSLGCTFYYAVTGKVPFPGGTVADKARAHCELAPLDPRRLNPALDAEFVDVIADMMAKDPAERIQSAGEVVVRLSPWSGLPVAPEAVEEARSRAAQRAVGRAAIREATPSAIVPAGTDDTKSSFPEMPELRTDSREGSGQVSQATSPGVATGEETLPALEPVTPPILLPLVVLVVLPVALAVLIALGVWAVQLLGR